MKSGWEGCGDGDPRARDKPFIAVLLLLPPCLPPSLLTLPRGPGEDSHSPLLSSDIPVSGHCRPHLTDGDTKTWGKATPGLCPGVGPQADTCRSPVPLTPASLQPWRARWSPAALRAKHDRLWQRQGRVRLGRREERQRALHGEALCPAAFSAFYTCLLVSSAFLRREETGAQRDEATCSESHRV